MSDMENIRQEMLEEAKKEAQYEADMRSEDTEFFIKEADKQSGIIEAVSRFKKMCEYYDQDAKEELLAMLDYC